MQEDHSAMNGLLVIFTKPSFKKQAYSIQMILQELIQYLEAIAPPIYQESYDNSGLLVGAPNLEIKGVMTCLDATEEVLDAALENGCNVVVAHHPIIFKGLKRLTGKNYVERVIIKAIKHDLAIYAIHTNLDNMYYNGVNTKIAAQLGLVNTQILAPKAVLKKATIYVGAAHSEKVRTSLLSLQTDMHDRIQPNNFALLGVNNKDNQSTASIKLELRFTIDQEYKLLQQLHQLQTEFPLLYEISALENVATTVGSGMIGDLPEPMEATSFLAYLKSAMQVNCIKHTKLLDKPIQKVAVCGGTGGFLLSNAKRKKADIFITSDYKYHEFFDADGQIIIADIGHYESEQFTSDLLQSLISEKFSTFAVLSTTVRTNPVFYYT